MNDNNDNNKKLRNSKQDNVLSSVSLIEHLIGRATYSPLLTSLTVSKARCLAPFKH